ncbi:MAG: thioesterase family protein [Acidiferrobacterales bacterium]|nr:thioesterase family protein [Acidiferrobacterales bacterium]
MILFTDLMASLSRSDERDWQVNIPDTWMQGRTTYGGLSAALCLQAIYNEYANLAPLRSAQISFVGPAGGNLTISSKVLRRGKSVSYVSAEIKGEQGIATHAVFCFGTSRPSNIEASFVGSPRVPDSDESTDFFKRGPGPVFTKNFDCLYSSGSQPISNAEDPDFHLWVRHKDKAANDIIALLSLADMAPPAILTMFKEIKPVSSMTWMINFLDDKPQTNEGWWLLNSKAEYAKDGYSSQSMKLWNSEGQLTLSGQQNVAIFY